VFFDITDQELEGYNKFIPYYLHPECTYSVGLSRSSFRNKFQSGPIRDEARRLGEPGQDLRTYGGGGHARVGAISFDVSKGEEARKAALEIVAELRASSKASGA